MKTLIVIAFMLIVTVVKANESSANVNCYVCMGRDSENCVVGEARCYGYCYKVVDATHDLIAKGCTTTKDDLPIKDEVSDWAPTPQIKLYWTKTENGDRDYIRGRSYFCNSNLCNTGSNFKLNNKFLGFIFGLISLLALRF